MFTKDEKARRIYELAEKSRRDRMSMIHSAERRGREKGREEGLAEGRESMIINMLKANLSDRASSKYSKGIDGVYHGASEKVSGRRNTVISQKRGCYTSEFSLMHRPFLVLGYICCINRTFWDEK